MVEAGSPEYKAWVRYFRKQGFKPHMLTLVERKVIDKITVPAMLPEMFDATYVDSGGIDEVEWQRGTVTPEMRAMGKAWLDRSDPVAASMVTDDVQSKSAHVGQIVTYPEFLQHTKANNLSSVPIGAFEPGGYLGSSEIDTAKKRKVYTAAEKAAFVESARQAGKELSGMKLSPETQALLREV
jgi:hypothetical protein